MTTGHFTQSFSNLAKIIARIPMTNFARASILLSLVASCLYAQPQVRETAAKSESDIPSLSDTKIVSGLKEALELSTNKAVAITGKHDGFMKNEAIRILLPPKLQAIGKGMRMLGMGEQVDDLEIGMNRAAEQAAPQAKPIFLAALKKMTFHDARQILTGNDTAATDYFRRTTNEDLSAAFTPIVHRQLEKVGVVHQYNQVIKEAPGASALANEFDLDQYVVEKTLDGIFYELGIEESQIRHDPAKQASDLLKEVFGKK
jgi:hypothetical protein